MVWNRLKLKAPADNKGGEIEPPAPRSRDAFKLDGVWEKNTVSRGHKQAITFKGDVVIGYPDQFWSVSREDGFIKCMMPSGFWFKCKPDPNNLDVMTGMRKNGDKLIFTRVK